MRIIHFSFRKTPVSILLKKTMLMIKEKAVGIHKPKRFRTNAVRETAGIKMRAIAKTKMIAE